MEDVPVVLYRLRGKRQGVRPRRARDGKLRVSVVVGLAVERVKYPDTSDADDD